MGLKRQIKPERTGEAPPLAPERLTSHCIVTAG